MRILLSIALVWTTGLFAAELSTLDQSVKEIAAAARKKDAPALYALSSQWFRSKADLSGVASLFQLGIETIDLIPLHRHEEDRLGYVIVRIVYTKDKERRQREDILFFDKEPDGWRYDVLSLGGPPFPGFPSQLVRGFYYLETPANQRPDGTSVKTPPSNPRQGAVVPHP